MSPSVALRLSRDAVPPTASPGRRKAPSSVRIGSSAAAGTPTLPPPRFDDLKEERAPRYLRWLVVTVFVHLIVLGLGLSAALPKIASPRVSSADDLTVTLVDPLPSSFAPQVREKTTSEIKRSTSTDADLTKTSDTDGVMTSRGEESAVPANPASPRPASSTPMPSPRLETNGQVSTRGITANLASAPPRVVTASRSPAEIEWERSIVTTLERNRHYPASALRAGVSAVVMLRLVIGRDGKLLAAEIANSPGVASLDRTAVAMAVRSSPFPAPPAAMDGDAFRLLVPVEFAAGRR